MAAFYIRRNGSSVVAPMVFTSTPTSGDGASATLKFYASSTTYHIPMVQDGKTCGSYAYRPKNAFQLHAYKNGVVHAINGQAPYLEFSHKVTATRTSTGSGTTLQYRATFSTVVIKVKTCSPGMSVAIPISYTIGGKSGTVSFNAGVTSQEFSISVNYTTGWTSSSDPGMSVSLTIAAGNYYASKALTCSTTAYYSYSGMERSFYTVSDFLAMASKIF